MQWPAKGAPSAGLYAGTGAWIISTQLGYSIVPWVCAHGSGITIPSLTTVLALCSGFGAFLSWRAMAAPTSAETSSARFIAGLGALAGTLFALVIIVQGLAGFVLTGCER